MATGGDSRAENETARETTRFVDPVRPVRTFETAIDEIILGIDQARLRTGDALPNETQLADQLGISKPTLRQALRVLERSGLITVRRGKVGGIFMATDFLPRDAISENIVLEEDAVVELLRARRAFETAVNLEAVYAATEDDFAEIERTVDLLAVPNIDADRILRADAMFHRAIARATHNSVFDQVQRVVSRRLTGIRHEQLGSNAVLVQEIHAEHLAALRSRDPVELAGPLDRHFHFLEDMVAQSMQRPWEELFAPDAPPRRSTPAPVAAGA